VNWASPTRRAPHVLLPGESTPEAISDIPTSAVRQGPDALQLCMMASQPRGSSGRVGYAAQRGALCEPRDAVADLVDRRADVVGLVGGARTRDFTGTPSGLSGGAAFALCTSREPGLINRRGPWLTSDQMQDLLKREPRRVRRILYWLLYMLCSARKRCMQLCCIPEAVDGGTQPQIPRYLNSICAQSGGADYHLVR
jgi:hypothetical protein